MVRSEDVPPELWRNILDFLDGDPPATERPPEMSRATPDTPLKNVSLVSKFLRMNSLAVLFKYGQIQQYFSERKIKRCQDAVLTNCLEFIKRHGLQNHITCMTFRVIVDEKVTGA